MNQGDNDHQNIHQFLTLHLVPLNRSHSSMHDQTPCKSHLSPSHHLLHLFNSPSLQLLSWHHLSHISQRPSHHLSLSLSHRLSFVKALSLTCHNIIISRNITTKARTSHHHLFASSHVIIYACYDLNSHIITLSWSIRFHVNVRTSAHQQPIQPAMVRTLTCHGSYLNMSVRTLAC